MRPRAGFGTLLVLALAVLAIALVLLLVGDAGGRGTRVSLESTAASARALSAAHDAIADVCASARGRDGVLAWIVNALPGSLERSRLPGELVAILDPRNPDGWERPADEVPGPGLRLNPDHDGQLDFLEGQPVAFPASAGVKNLTDSMVREIGKVSLRPLYYRVNPPRGGGATGTGRLFALVRVSYRVGGRARSLLVREARPFSLMEPPDDDQPWTLRIDDAVLREVLDE